MAGSKPVGRPNKVLAPATVTKLTAAFANGFNITQACQYADIAEKNYYHWFKRNKQFREDMTKAQGSIGQMARKVIADSLKSGDLRAARYWLDRRDPEFSPKAELKHDINPVDEILKQFKLDDKQIKTPKKSPPKK